MKIDVICHCKNCTFILTKDETTDTIKTCQSYLFLLASVYWSRLSTEQGLPHDIYIINQGCVTCVHWFAVIAAFFSVSQFPSLEAMYSHTCV